MFDLTAGTPAGAAQHRHGPPALSRFAHAGLVTMVAVPALLVVGAAPGRLPTMMAIVVPADLIPPPQPPPPPAAPRARQADVKSVVASPTAASSSEPPLTIAPDGGIEPAAPPPAPRTPRRAGGQFPEPRVLSRVPRVYPELAGRVPIPVVVIVEATVDEDGAVQNVKVLRRTADPEWAAAAIRAHDQDGVFGGSANGR